jgi:hypothetical protein
MAWHLKSAWLNECILFNNKHSIEIIDGCKNAFSVRIKKSTIKKETLNLQHIYANQ